MSGYGFDRPYIFAQIHFHWGEDNLSGSEHTLNDKHFPLEVHLVHYDSKYKSFAEAESSGESSNNLFIIIT
jgi:carbonic anhydrase